MSKMLGGIVCGLLMLFATSANATITIAQQDTTTTTSSNSGFTAWAVTPNTADSTAYTNNAFVSFGANIANYFQPENNYGSVPTGGSLAESFAATTGGTLSDVQIIVSGNIQGTTVNLALYDAGPAPGNPSLQKTSSNTYSPGASGVSNNLLTNGNGVTMPAYSTTGATAAILDFQMSGADAVSINSGDEYVFELSNPSNSANLIWFRMISPTPVVDTYPAGQAFRGRAPLNGSNVRDMSLAVTVVPEPGTLMLLSLSAPALFWSLRKRK